MPTTVRPIGDLDIHYDDQTGQILRVHDRVRGMDVIAFRPGHELEINRVPLPLKLVSQDDLPRLPAWQCNLRGSDYASIGAAREFDLFRQVVVGWVSNPGGGHINPPDCLHIRYRLERRQLHRWDTPEKVPMSAGQRPIQMPLWLDTIGTLCARTDWFGPETRMIQSSVGGNGPRSHVSHEDGLVKDVTPHLWNMYRRAHPGVQAIPGAVYYHPDGRWLWITAQRPSVGMHWDFENDRLAAQFQYHALLKPAEIVHTPEVSLYWGKGGRPEMMACLNNAFIALAAPPPWWFRTIWYWLHWWQYRPGGFVEMADQAEYLHDTLGLNGFGITGHDVRPGCFDCAPTGLRPSPHWGGDEGLRQLGERVRKFGGHMYVWLPFLGLAQPGLDLRESWRIKGEDGRPYESFYIGSFDMYHAVNFNHPEVQAYYLRWIERYIKEFHVDGIFWDCGGSPMAPDFSPAETRPFQRFPSESMVAPYKFMEEVMRFGRQCSPDFFMWHECFSADLPATAYYSGVEQDRFLIDLNRYGRKRVVFKGHSAYNLYGGFPTVSPGSDTAFKSPVTRDTFAPMIADRMNQWLVKFVREQGVEDAKGLDMFVAYCKGHIIVDPAKEPRDVLVPPEIAAPRQVRNVVTGATIKPVAKSEAGVTFRLAGGAAYECA